MKKLLLLAVIASCLLISCKKDNNQPAVASAEELAAINTKLSGTWAVAGLPLVALYPYNGSMVFDGGSTVKFNDFANAQTQQQYTLTGTGGVFYINTVDQKRKCKIISLTADTLKIQTVLQDNGPITFKEVFVKANAIELNNKIFKINITPFTGGTALVYSLNVNVKIYITPTSGTETLAFSQNNINQALTYSYTPKTGDHIRIAVTSADYPGSMPVFTCLAYYKGVPLGRDWQSVLFSSVPNKGWDIEN